MWAKFDDADAVYYDITWTGLCGEPPDRVREVFETVRDARDRAIDTVAAAVSAGREIRGFEVDDAARSYIRTRGYADRFVHRTGHSIGTEVHGTGANMDNLETHDERRILPGALFPLSREFTWKISASARRSTCSLAGTQQGRRGPFSAIWFGSDDLRRAGEHLIEHFFG